MYPDFFFSFCNVFSIPRSHTSFKLDPIRKIYPFRDGIWCRNKISADVLSALFSDLTFAFAYFRWKELARRVVEVLVFGIPSHILKVSIFIFQGHNGILLWNTYCLFTFMCSGLWSFHILVLFLPGKIIDGSNGDVAVDQYHRYEVTNGNCGSISRLLLISLFNYTVLPC